MGLRFTGDNFAELATPITQTIGSSYTVAVDFRLDKLTGGIQYLIGDVSSTDNYIRLDATGIIVFKIGGRSYNTGIVASMVADTLVEAVVDASNVVFKVDSLTVSTQTAPILEYKCRWVALYKGTSNNFNGTINSLQIGGTSWAFVSENLYREPSVEAPEDALKDLIYTNILYYNWHFDTFTPVLVPAGKHIDKVVVIGASVVNSSYEDPLYLDAEIRYRDLGYNAKVYERADSGDDAGELKNRIRVVIDEFKAAADTTLVVIHCGGNNISADGPYPGGEDELHADLEALLFELKYEGFSVSLSTITWRRAPASNPSDPYNINIIVPLQAIYSDTNLDLYTQTETNEATWIGADGIHPTVPVGRTGIRNYITDTTAVWMKAPANTAELVDVVLQFGGSTVMAGNLNSLTHAAPSIIDVRNIDFSIITGSSVSVSGQTNTNSAGRGNTVDPTDNTISLSNNNGLSDSVYVNTGSIAVALSTIGLQPTKLYNVEITASRDSILGDRITRYKINDVTQDLDAELDPPGAVKFLNIAGADLIANGVIAESINVYGYLSMLRITSIDAPQGDAGTYVHFDHTKPDGTVDNGAQTLTVIRNNLQAMSDAVILGVMPGWNMSIVGGTAEEPGELHYTKSPEVIKAVLVWGTSGGGDGNVTHVVFTHSPDGIAFNTVGTVTITYDADGNALASNWS